MPSSFLLHTVRVHGSMFPVLLPPPGHVTQLVRPLLAVPYSFATLAMRKLCASILKEDANLYDFSESLSTPGTDMSL
jgi:hypothetical protein